MTYDHLAREAIDNKGITGDFFWQQFFYPFFLMIVYSLTNYSILAVKIIQITLGSITCALVYGLGEKIFDRKTGVLAGCITAIYGPLVFFDGELLAASWATFWTVVLLLLLIKAAESKNIKFCILLGLSSGISVVTRPNFIPFLALSYLWLLITWVRDKVSFNKLVVAMASTMIGLLIITIPVSAKNYQLSKRFSFLPGTGGVNMYIGNNPGFEATSIRPGRKWEDIMERPARHGVKTKIGARQFYYDETFNYIKTQPINFIKGILHKTAEFLSSREMPGNIDIYLFRKWSSLHSILTWKTGSLGFPFGLLLPLAIIGIFFYWRNIPVPMLLFLLFYPATIILMHIEARYRMPIIVPLSILAGASLVKIYNVFQLKQWRILALLVVCILAIAFLCSIAGPFYSEQYVNYEAELRFSMGDALGKRGETERAIEEYTKALELSPDSEAHFNLAIILADRQKYDEAIEHYNIALKFDPADDDLHTKLGVALYKKGNTEEAINHYKKAISLNPDNSDAHNNLANALFKIGKKNEALKHYSKALELKPDDAILHSNFGNVLAMSGKLDEAIKHYRISLEIRPDNAQTLSNLGNALLGLERLKEAEAKYKESLKLSRKNAGTFFNLGTCLERQGRIDEAIINHKQALRIDPLYKQAQHALDRLSKNN
jgi:tetratricopeptide (TPR) repeat protein